MGTAAEAARIKAGRIIVPGTDRQLAAFGLFPPSSAQHGEVAAAAHTFTAKASDAELLWIGFGELCRLEASPAAYADLARRHPLWVVDGVPAPGSAGAVKDVGAWAQFAAVLAVLAAEGTTLFVVGRRPMDWDAAAHEAEDAGLRASLAAVARRLELMVRVESDESVAVVGVSGS